MTGRRAPRLDTRRTADFAAELRERARAWIPTWDLADADGDFGRALLDIAARFSSEVAERLDGSGEKMRRGFLDWLAVGRQAARPARMPVVFQLTAGAPAAVLAQAPVRMQVDAEGTAVVFETETSVRIVPGQVAVVVAADAAGDAFYVSPPGLSDLGPVEPLPTEWLLKSFASVGATRLQLDPEVGLARDMIVEAGGRQYRIVQAEGDLATIEPPLDGELAAGARVAKVTTFAPFGGTARNWQAHALYLGDSALLDIEAAATLVVEGAGALQAGITWQYWGSRDPHDEVDWQPLVAAPEDQPATGGALVLSKPKGAMAERIVGGRSSRWIRAFTPTLPPDAQPFSVDGFRLRVNAEGCDDEIPCPPGLPAPASPAAAAMANTTPLVIDSVFFPLGKEPKQFDAFYLGSQEAFSKKAANVQLCFELADPTFSALSAVPEGMYANAVLGGIARDRALHLMSIDQATGNLGKFLERQPLQPPSPGFSGAETPGGVVALDQNVHWRLPVWSEAELPPEPRQGFFVAATGADALWVWHEHPDRTASGWIRFADLPSDGQAQPAPVDGVAFLAGAPAKLAVLRGGHLYFRDWPAGAEWTDVETLDGLNTVTLRSIVPVLVTTPDGQLVTAAASGLVGVSADNRLYHVALDGVCTEVDAAADFTGEVRPVAIESGGDLIVAAVKGGAGELWAFHQTQGSEHVDLDAGVEVVGPLEAVLDDDGEVYVLAAARDQGNGHLTVWAPFAGGAASWALDSPVSLSGGLLGGAVTSVGQHVVIPGTRADVLVSDFDPARRHAHAADIGVGVVVPEALSGLTADDLILRLDGNDPEPRRITHAGLTAGGEIFYRLESPFPPGATGLFAYDVSETLPGVFTAPDRWELDESDLQTDDGTWLSIDGEFYHVDDIVDPLVSPRVAQISSPTAPMPASGPYVRPTAANGRVAPFMALDPNPDGNGDWDAGLLGRVPVVFPDETPSEQRGKAFSVAVGNKPVVVVLGQQFDPPAGSPAEFVIDAAVGGWRRMLGETSSNPELSWEYWNGRGWWGLDVTFDSTLHLKTTGAVRFAVPSDIAPTDWAGQTNHWIRARLIGGDYGREKVTVTTTPLSGGATEQTVERSTEGIRAPSVLALHISYAMCEPVLPAFVLAEDSGTIRDLSDANRTAGAVVEAFVPLRAMLEGLEGRPPADGSPEACPPVCGCGTHEPPPAAAAPAAPRPASSRAAGRAIFVGADAALSDAPVNLLLLVEPHDYRDFAPMQVEAIVSDRFVPIVADDSTRALGESGVLSMSFTVPPTRRGLFGRQLVWLRLSPADGDASSAWRPAVRGAYLNAAWASATETLTRELLGSSEGAPNLTFRLQRPPVLRHTLQLRVKEPLGDEERSALASGDAGRVSSAVDGLPGDWVLWDQVVDPADESPMARVYALDEATGEIRFGDGLHGMIPPVGRDSIVAFSYKRTEVGAPGGSTVPANSVAAHAAMNLITPVAGVEAVFAADHAAGGAPAESDQRVLRFGFARLRHRNRAVTLQDLEDLALQSSPDIVQARAARQGSAVRLTVVMAGANPWPTASQARELRTLLLSHAPLALSAPGVLRVVGPAVRRLRIGLALRVETLDDAGAAGSFVKQRLTDFFDSATGGIDAGGWALGLSPTADDVAFALVDAPDVASLLDVSLREVTPDGAERPWPSSLAPTELAVLDDDPFRLDVETAEVTA